MRFLKSNFNYIYSEFINYPVYANLSYLWNFGVTSGICLVVQIITGIFLAMHYIPCPDLAFNSIEHIMRDVNYGWLLRYVHANGASFFFFLVYVHISRNLFFNSFMKPREILWCSGVLILLIMILTAFLGYVLPWGQMSFWAATVITSLFSAFPFIGTIIVQWLWGGFSVDTATLNRFFSLHYLLPFFLLGLVFVHLILLHKAGSSNPLGITLNEDKVPFNPYYVVKDLFGLVVFFLIFFIFVMFMPNFLGHTDNYIPANPLVTPTHIVPEWYFLPFYAILRSIPNKLGGVIMLAFAIITLFILPYISQYRFFRTTFASLWHHFFFWFFIFVCILLGWIGGNPIEYPFYLVGQVLTSLFFISLFFLFNFGYALNFHLTVFIWHYWRWNTGNTEFWKLPLVYHGYRYVQMTFYFLSTHLFEKRKGVIDILNTPSGVAYCFNRKHLEDSLIENLLTIPKGLINIKSYSRKPKHLTYDEFLQYKNKISKFGKLRYNSDKLTLHKKRGFTEVCF